jgi:hypothetical protein
MDWGRLGLVGSLRDVKRGGYEIIVRFCVIA